MSVYSERGRRRGERGRYVVLSCFLVLIICTILHNSILINSADSHWNTASNKTETAGGQTPCQRVCEVVKGHKLGIKYTCLFLVICWKFEEKCEAVGV